MNTETLFADYDFNTVIVAEQDCEYGLMYRPEWDIEVPAIDQLLTAFDNTARFAN